MPLPSGKLKLFSDVAVTILIWVYFTAGFLIFFSPRYGWAWLRAKDRETAFQRLNQRFFSCFFQFLCRITPGLSLRIHDDVSAIRSSIIISNHISYLDPLLLISLFERQKSIVKKTFFKVPIFNWLLRQSGYLSSTIASDGASLMVRNIESIKEYLSSGGNLFIFPEGTRSRTGQLGSFNKGAFSIAHYCSAPIECLLIRRTNLLFMPGISWFNTCVPNTIEVERIGAFFPDYKDPDFHLTVVSREIHKLYEDRLKEDHSPRA
jgi:1-acyl-sn-glycerol-3-phosphate acyltransferase